MNLRAQYSWHHRVRRAGLPLALFAILFQAAVVFGHHHFDIFGARSAALTVAAQSSQEPVSHDKRIPALPTDTPCFVCLAVHASAAPAVDAVQDYLPVDFGGVPVRMPAAASIAAPPRVAAFNSRAPPLS